MATGGRKPWVKHAPLASCCLARELMLPSTGSTVGRRSIRHTETHPSHRGQGLITQLSKKVYEDVKEQGYDFTIGFSNDEGVKVDKNSRDYGYKIIGKFISYYKFIIYKKKTGFHLESTKNFLQIPQNCSLYSISSTTDYLEWRFRKKPNHNYEQYTVLDENDNKIGIVVLRTKYGRYYVLKILAHCMQKNTIDEILKAIENLALQKGERLLIYSVLNNSFWESLFGNYRYFKKNNNSVNYYLTIKIHNQNLNKDELTDKNNWFIMNGDII
jgi:predicted GNAT family acetyltransferase